VKTAAVLVRRNAVVGTAAAVATAVVVVAGIISTISPPSQPGLLASLVGFGWPFSLALVAGWAGYWRAWHDKGSLELVDGALLVDGVMLRAAGTLGGGEAAVLDDGTVRVDLRARGRPRIRLQVSDITVARELLAALGLDRRAGTSQFRIRRLRDYQNLLVMAAFFTVPLTFALCTVSVPLGLFALALVILTPIADRVAARVELTVGSDGIGVRSPLGREFIPHARIRKIERTWPEDHQTGSMHEGEVVSWGFAIELDDERKLSFDTRHERFPAGVWRTDPIFDAASAAWSCWKTSASSARPHAGALLARGGRSSRDWIASLRDLALDGASGYRVAALDEQALFAILADAEAPRELRAGAAIALGVREEHAPRLRVAVDDVADPVVRRVAVAVACVDPEAVARLEAELDEAFAAQPAAPARRRV